MRSKALVRWSLVALLAAGCGGETAESEGTDSTSRVLLNTVKGATGPATSFDSLPGLVAPGTTANIMDLGFNLGDTVAPVKLIEFSDFGCGFCRRFHEESFDTLRVQFVESGKIEWKFMPFITGMFPNSLAVTEASECTLEQDARAYEAVGDMLWSRQAEWKESGEAEALVRSWVADTGVDMERFDSCLAEDRRMPRIAGATVMANQLGVRATPTFWIVGYGPLQGALPLDVFQGVLGTVHDEIVAILSGAAPPPLPQGPPGA